MILSNYLRVCLKTTRGRRLVSLAPVLAIFSSTLCTLGFLLAAQGLRDARAMVKGLPVTRVVVIPKTSEILLFRTPRASLTQESLTALSSLPGVARVMPEQLLPVPASLVATLPGTTFSTDCAVYGVEPDFLPDPPAQFRRRGPGEPVPALVSSHLVEFFNVGFALAHSIPMISPRVLLGTQFDLVLGASSFAGVPRPHLVHTVRCQIVGLSPLVSLPGITVPMAYTQEWHRLLLGSDTPPTFSSAHVEVVSAAQLAALQRALDERGLETRNPRQLGETIGRVAHILTWGLVALAAIFLLGAAVTVGVILSLEVSAHTPRIGLYQALGATPGQIRWIYAGRALLMGAVGSGAGATTALVLLGLLGRALPGEVWGNQWIHRGPLWAGAAVVLNLLMAAAASWFPASRASRVDPGESLHLTVV